ncbi:hypothetical protein V2G26_007161 [Clonostachys chloroleuca]
MASYPENNRTCWRVLCIQRRRCPGSYQGGGKMSLPSHDPILPLDLALPWPCLYQPSDADLALECAFDSIMVDGSMYDEEGNLKYVKSVVDRAKGKGITVEAELGRMEGGEDGLPTMDLENVLTDPDMATDFVKKTGIHFLAPSFGNVHGPYPAGGAEKHWRLDRLEKIHAALGDATPLVLHGTHPLSDKMVQVGMARGMVKVNQNRNIRDGYHKYIAKNCNKVELTTLQVEAVEEYSKGVERLMVEVFDSAGKA